eukprot:s1834_g5.t1
MAGLEIGPVEPVELFPATFVDTATDPPGATLPLTMDDLTVYPRDALLENTLVGPTAREDTTNHVNVTDGMLYGPDTQVYMNDMVLSSNVPVHGMASSSHEKGLVEPTAREVYDTMNHVNVTDGLLYAPDTQVYMNDMVLSSTVPVHGMASSNHEKGLVEPTAREVYDTMNHVNVTDGMLYAPDTQMYTNDMVLSSNVPVHGMASSNHENGAAYDPMFGDTQLYGHDVCLNPPGPACNNTVSYTNLTEMNYSRPEHDMCMMNDTEMMEVATHVPQVWLGPPCSTLCSDMVYGNGATYPHNQVFVDGVGTPVVWPNDTVVTSHPDLLYNSNGYDVANTDSYGCSYDDAQLQAPCSTPMSMVSQFGNIAHGDSQFIPDQDLQVCFQEFAGLSSGVIDVESGSEEEKGFHEVHQHGGALGRNSEQQAG